MMATLVLVRHGQSQWNLENRFTGWTDVDLTDQGRAEARRAGELLAQAGLRFTKAYTSDLKRAQETLDIILDVLGQKDLPVIKDQALNERHYGDLQGLNKQATAEKYGKEQVHLWRRSYDIAPPGGESLKDTAERTLPYFREHIVPDLDAGETVLVSAHGNSLRSIVMALDNLSKDEVVALEIGTGIPIVYEMGPGGKVLSKKILNP
ncbi:MAG: 2,3-bisphosphoglycerate-dependent phosphoglycerate mutase [Deltaproteobacteria bacterium]|nr:MAG: 2,3-bisphosphoglycerate-dependent phosphoglycerate mutase [Deltaproteobacteria bacterium]